tara:strand:+ start:9 stop:476 length:468 start_codon:yes stop_codon:yes gene_type:complete
MEIQGYPNYLIYPDGRVFSKRGKGKFLKDYSAGIGYRQIRLCNGTSDRKKMYIHRLIAIHYIPNPENKPEVDHKNRIRNDNRVENLIWATCPENNENKGMMTNNTSGHTNICRSGKKWAYSKNLNKITKYGYFNTLTEALCFKFIQILKIKCLIS